MNIREFFHSLVYCQLFFVSVVAADDWPTYQHDHARSGISSETLGTPLYEKWTHLAAHAPSPAWPAPAGQDYWHKLMKLEPRVTYDRAFHPVVAGKTLYFGSSADDRVYALDSRSGEVRWTFQTEGPVRLAPSIADDKVYFGSDDGCVYSLAASDGKLLWKRRIAPHDHRIPGNGRMISLFPVRTGVLVDDGVVYCCAGMLPAQGVYRCAIDAETGEFLWHEQTGNLSPQGYLLASESKLYVPTGRTSPSIFARSDGRFLGSVGGEGGSYALLLGDALVSGDNRTGDMLRVSDVSKEGENAKDPMLAFQGLRLLVSQDRAIMQSKDSITALQWSRYTKLASRLNTARERRYELTKELRKLGKSATGKQRAKLGGKIKSLDRLVKKLTEGMQACIHWREKSRLPYSLVLSGEVLFAGGDGQVVAIGAADGVELWKADVDGKAHGMCIADGSLYVSTDRGTIHCFSPTEVERPHIVKSTPQPYPEDDTTAIYAEAADQIVKAMWPDASVARRGYCLVLDCGEGRLAYELAKRTELQILGVDTDIKNVETARRMLTTAGIYGDRVTIHHQTSSSLPYGSFFANLVVSDRALLTGELPDSSEEVVRLLRPGGGLAMIGQGQAARKTSVKITADKLKKWTASSKAGQSKAGQWSIESHKVALPEKSEGLWAMLRRQPLPGGGEWTQLYANAEHTACSNDKIQGPTTLQWFGAPGPRRIIDRHHRPMSPLAKDGRIFVPADDAVIAVDAFNGTRLWETDVPNSRRVGAMKNSGQMLIEGENLYIAAEDECWSIDAVTGQRSAVIRLPKTNEGEPRHWGYLNCTGDQLFATGVKPTASFVKTWTGGASFLEGDFRPVVTGNSVFSVDRHTGKTLWTYENGAIMHSAIAIGQGRIYFAESRRPEIVSDEDGRVRIDDFCKGPTLLVALDLKTGKKVWERAVQLPHQHIMFLVVAGDAVLVTGSYNEGETVYYGLDTFDCSTGKPRWQTRFVATNIRGTEPTGREGSHGEQWQHPVVVGDKVYLRPYGFDLATGEKIGYHLYRGGHGCGGLTGSSNYLYGRGSNPRMYPLNVPSTEGTPLTRTTRPGCYLNIIPANGLLLIPESSSGCTCSYSLQTSLVFVPKSLSGAPF
ncbi:MAG: PQQ-binding-like beta-propeller repeat protein [Planctomycetes bacterium]|nr:PQQ-binding-like beta-propeller repeat protein [Planctomycetota bacterium]